MADRNDIQRQGPNRGNRQRYNSLTFTMAANDVREIDAYSFFFLADSTASINVRILSTGNSFALPARRGFRAPHGEDIGRVAILNDTGGAVTLTIDTGDGDPLDTRDSGSAGAHVNVNISSPNPLPCSIPAGVAVTGTVEVANDVGNPLPVNGTVTVGNPELNAATPLQGFVAAIADLVAHDIIGARGAGKKIACKALVFGNESAVATAVKILDGAVEIMRVWLPANTSLAVPLPDPLIGSAATALRMQNTINASGISVAAAGHEI